jgi:8-oxo-dGTP pyrophosphatase MutT (NUDIX family)/RimJ/RimL family protein N-acetyltransferase
MIRLLPLSSGIAEAVADPEAFARLTGAQLGSVGPSVQSVVAQDSAHRARTGGTSEWGGFLAVDGVSQQVVGVGGYVAAPDAQGTVEIAYGTFQPYEGRGYGFAIAGALIARALESNTVRLVYAHTLPEPNASTRILTKHGFTQVGTAHDEDAGLVWRWERPLPVTPRDNDAYRFPVSVKGVVVREGAVTLLYNRRGEWELPGGKLELSETPEQCVAREIEEELQLTVEASQLVDAWVYTITPGTHVLVLTYGCVETTKRQAVISHEHMRLRWVPLEEVELLTMPAHYKQSIRSWVSRSHRAQ